MTNPAQQQTLEAMQSDEKYRLSDDQVSELVKSFPAEYCCEVMIECGHTNQQIHDATGVIMQRISWMRTTYQTPPPRGELELRYRELNINKGFVHVVTDKERDFSRLFKCGVYHKNHVSLIGVFR